MELSNKYGSKHPSMIKANNDLQILVKKRKQEINRIIQKVKDQYELALSTEKSGISLGKLNQDKNGAPLPSDGNCWSISHKTQYVGGVVSPTPIGIDIERIRSCSEGIFRKTATENEWMLADSAENSLTVFFRYWTSKEAVLKALGTGIKDLLKCRIVQIIDNSHLNIRYANRLWLVEHKYFDHHIATIVKNSFQIDWTIS